MCMIDVVVSRRTPALYLSLQGGSVLLGGSWTFISAVLSSQSEVRTIKRKGNPAYNTTYIYP